MLDQLKAELAAACGHPDATVAVDVRTLAVLLDCAQSLDRLVDAIKLAGVEECLAELAVRPKDAPVLASLDTLAAERGWNDIEQAHAKGALDVDYGPEAVIALANGRAIHCPAFPAPCDYVRVVDQGYELMYWNSDEWAEDAQEVIGAFLGLAKGA